MMTPIESLRRRAEVTPDQVAFIAGDDTWTYRRLAAEVERAAQAFIARGVQPGDRVALHMANLPEMAVAVYACFSMGAIAAPLNIRFKAAELHPLLRRLKPRLYVGQAALYAQVAAIETECLAADARFIAGRGSAGDLRARRWENLIGNATGGSMRQGPDVDAPALLLTTSGTTGQPKFVTHTPATLAATLAATRYMGFDEQHTAINCAPMVHASGLFIFAGCIFRGMPMVLLERFDAGAVLDAIERHHGTWLLGLPFMFVELIEAQRARPRRVGSLRLCAAGGDVCPVQIQTQFEQQFGLPLYAVWGATEVVGSITYGLRIGPVSRVSPGAQIRIVDDHGAPVRRGEVGELLVRGPNVTVGYWAGPGRVDDATTEGWYATGDLMRLGVDDEIWFVARKKDLIIRGGSNIAPVEVEQVLQAHPAVRAAAVVGIPDEKLGQRVAAAVELAGRADRGVLDDILAHARTQLADYKVPEQIIVVDEIPKNNLGKVDRRTLADLLMMRAPAKGAVMAL